MSSEPASPHCPHCGEPLSGSPSGLMDLCPRCLLATGTATLTADGPARAFTPPPPEDLARYFPQLEILELLGRGGMGAVYKARQRELDRIVALKILPPDIGDSPAFSERFTREARALAKLNHPHIVTLYDFGQADGLYYFFMEYVDGANLRQILNGGRMAPKEALAIVPQICDALQYAHDRGIVHRDIKPENILLGRDGAVKIADFGVARLLTGEPAASPDPESARVVGTPSYMAPEQVNTPQEADHRADIYSLGVVLYQMLTGELPGHNLLKPSRRVQIDIRLDEIILRALEQNPEQRYQQASLLRTQLETLGASPTPPRPPQPEPPASLWRRIWAVVIDLLLVPVAVFPFLVLLAIAFPRQVVLEVPFGLFTEEKVIKTEPYEEDGVKSRIRQIEVTPLGLETYTYTEITPLDRPDAKPARHLADPLWAVRATPTSKVNGIALFLYWILLESSPLQGSLGKRFLGLRVTDRRGRRIGFWHSLWRNAAKLLTLATGGLGFLIAAITPGKRTLHDFLSRSRVAPGNTAAPRALPIALRCVIAVALSIAFPLAQNAYANWWFHNYSERTVREMRSPLDSRRKLLEQSAPSILPGLLETLKKEGDTAAVGRLLSVNWETQRLFPPGDPMAISEGEFMRLPYRERNQRQEAFLEMMKQLRTLIQAMLKAGQEAIAVHDWNRAEHCFTSLQKLGRMIDRGDHTLTLHYMGQSMEMAGLRRLAELNATRSSLKGLVYSPEKTVSLEQPSSSTPFSAPAYLRFSDGKVWTLGELEHQPDANGRYDVVAAFQDTDLFGLVGSEMIVLPIGGEKEWDKLPADMVYHGPAGAKPGNPVFIPFNQQGGKTVYLFHTRDGARGLLQFVSADEAKKTLRFRYKLARLPDPPKQGDQTAASQISPPEAFSSKAVAKPRLQFRAAAKEDATDAETFPYRWQKDETLRLEPEIALTEGDVFSAELKKLDDERFAVDLTLTDEGSRKFSALTARSLQRRVAILLDGEILTAPVVMAHITGGSVSITGAINKTEAHELLKALRGAIQNRGPANANFTINWINWQTDEKRGDTTARWLPDGSPSADSAALPSNDKLDPPETHNKDYFLSFHITPAAKSESFGRSAKVTDTQGRTISTGYEGRRWLSNEECLFSISISSAIKFPAIAFLHLIQAAEPEQLKKTFDPKEFTSIPLPGNPNGSFNFNIPPATQTPEGNTVLQIAYPKRTSTPENVQFSYKAVLKNGKTLFASRSSGHSDQGITTLRLEFKTPLSEVDHFEQYSQRLHTVVVPFQIPRPPQ